VPGLVPKGMGHFSLWHSERAWIRPTLYQALITQLGPPCLRARGDPSRSNSAARGQSHPTEGSLSSPGLLWNPRATQTFMAEPPQNAYSGSVEQESRPSQMKTKSSEKAWLKGQAGENTALLNKSFAQGIIICSSTSKCWLFL